MIIQKEIQSQYTAKDVVARWVLIDNQNTCHYDIVKVIDGWWENSVEAQEAFIEQTGCGNIFAENCFSVKPIEFSKEYWVIVASSEEYRYKVGIPEDQKGLL